MLKRATETTLGRLALLLSAVAAIVLGSAAVAQLVLDQHQSFGESVWSATVHLLDPSSLQDDHGTGERAIGLFQVITGLVLIVGLLFTVVAEQLGRSLERLGQADRPVGCSGHLLLVGGTRLVPIATRSIAEALRLAGSAQRLVVLAPDSARESRAQLRDALEEATSGLRFDLVFGDTAGDSGFELAGAERAATILLMATSGGGVGAEAADVEVTQSGLALLDYLRERGGSPLVRLLFRRGRNVDPAWELFPEEWDAVVGDRSIGGVLRVAMTKPRKLEDIPGGIQLLGRKIDGFADLVEDAWAAAEAGSRPLRLTLVGCGINAPALMEDLSQVGAERFRVTVLATAAAYETYLGTEQRYGVPVEFVESSADDPEALLAHLDAARPDVVLVTPSPANYDMRSADAVATLSTLRTLGCVGANVPVLAELFQPDTAARLPDDRRLLAISSMRAVVIAVTLSIFEPKRAAELERRLAADATDP